MKTYTKGGEMAEKLLASVVKEHHPELAKVQFDVLMVFTDSEGAALSSGGYRLAAQVRILPLKQRTAGRGDAEILLDGEAFKQADDSRRRAILDHELTHLAPKLDKQERPVLDALGRLRLVMRLHDWHFGWFDSVAERHGEASLEVEQARTIQAKSGQIYFELTDVTTEAQRAGRN